MRMLVVSLALLVFTFTVPALAEEESREAVKAKTDNPHIQVMNDKAKALAGSLSEEESKDLGLIRENFGILRSIEVARKTVKEAVDLCADKNADLKGDITAKHKSWHDEIGTVLDKQEKELEKSISKDHFSKHKEIKAYLDSIDEAASYADGKIEKDIVTTPEACKNLMGSMDDTKTVIISLISELSWPGDTAKAEPEKAAN